MLKINKVAALAVATSGLVVAGAGAAAATTTADGSAEHSPGIGSGNVIQLPINAPVNVCGDTVSIIGLLNPAFGDKCWSNS